ncbi:PREDICTED: retinol dehydrogenase 13-like [Branchiostoma belcheri]|uniref:Retinol dehydrogenase 13-like n=1 Tax=Branchiostoma belcheri TaxID=7741 RepID=A0A6P4Z7N8_BRABE|nr:PREDICTED: retinol dehydrogenase 13-like [Branchiostoma belcheri]
MGSGPSRRCHGGVCRSEAKLDGKTVIITGSNTGIGKVTAKDMARRGARVIMACRDLTRAEAAASEIRQETGNENVVVEKLDLASLASVREFATKINQQEGQLDILINNAGIMFCPQWKTADGFEMQFGTNHLGHFLLTNLLLDKIKASAPSRIVVVASLAHESGRMNFDDVNMTNNYSTSKAYSQSKLANILFARELARRLEGTKVIVNSLHPGIIETELQRNMSEGCGFTYTCCKCCFWCLLRCCGKSQYKGAQTTIHCAVDEQIEGSGLYFSDCVPKQPAPQARDDEAAKRLWDISEEMVGLKKD